MAEVEFHLHNEVGIKFPPLRPAYSDGELYFGRFRGLVARSTGTSVIGEGGTGRIHLVRDELMEREVALKIPLDSILRDPAAREDVIQETRQAMDLTHPNIVRIHDFHEGQGKWGISMQYVRGKNLDEWRYDSETTGFRRVIRPYTVEAIRDWIAQLCDALRYAHEDARMVHRDIKPKNLMLEKRDGGEKVYITDFGISQRLRLHTMMLSRDQTKVGESKGNMGTLPYMPWEQIAGAAASPLDDVYAVGATIYELITGRPPFYDGGFEQIKVQIREVPPPSMEQRILDLGLHMPPPPDEWEAAVAACLAKRPEDRPQSMRALAAALGFQSGSNTELEAKVSSQSERINELETQIITLSHAPAPVAAANPELEADLAAARGELARLRTELEAAKGGQGALETIRAERDAALAQAGELGPLRDELSAARAEVAALTALKADLEAARGELGGADAALAELNRRVADEARRADEAAAEVARLRQAEQDLAAKLAATETERDSALQGGDQALRTFQEESARRIAQAEDRVAAAEAKLAAAEASSDEALRQERQAAQQRIADAEAKLQALSKESENALQQARQAAAAELQQVRQAAATELQQVRQQADQEIQRARQEAASSSQAATEKARREAEQANEKARKAEEASAKAVAQAREEGEKRLQKQAEELEKTRQSLAKTVDQKERLEREVATERERQGASLKPLLVSLVIAMVLGLGAGLGTSLFTGGKADSALDSNMVAYLPPENKVAQAAVPFDLFERYAAAVGVKPDDLHATKGPDGSVRGVSAMTAMNFCNWLTEKQRADSKLAQDMHYTLPEFPEIQGKAAAGSKEWSATWAESAASGVLKVAGDDKSPKEGYEVHAIHHSADFTFRVALRKVPAG
ncbi:MAG: protein kinase [Verrucomicrobia bacterium]|nr:protein kinase [Verrucomicrobiota bacterium]